MKLSIVLLEGFDFYDKRAVYQNNRAASEQHGTRKTCDKFKSYADRAGVLRVSTLPFYAFRGSQSVAFACSIRSCGIVCGIDSDPQNYQCAKTL